MQHYWFSFFFLLFFSSYTELHSPKIMVTKQSPVDDVEQNKTGREQPSRNSVHQDRFFSLLFHHVAYLLLTLQLNIVYHLLQSLGIYHIGVDPRTHPQRWRRWHCFARWHAAGHGGHVDGIGSRSGLHATVAVHEVCRVRGTVVEKAICIKDLHSVAETLHVVGHGGHGRYAGRRRRGVTHQRLRRRSLASAMYASGIAVNRY